MTLTDEQQAIVSYPLPPGTALKARAYAGAGKTSTLVALAEKLAPDEVCYLAFNKSVVSEATMKFPTNTKVCTAHSLAYQTDGRKYGRIAPAIYNWQLTKAYGISVYEAALLIRTLNNYLVSADRQVEPHHCHPDSLNRFPGYPSRLMDLTEVVWRDMVNATVPMTHDGYMKLFHLKDRDLFYPTILLDEAQDTTPVLFAILQREVSVNQARLVLVGDPYQQIYSWRGAVDAMSAISAPELRITQSFRFGDAIAHFASRLLAIVFDEQVPIRGLPTCSSTIGPVGTDKHTVICRTNTGLVAAAYNAAMQGRSIHVIGEGAFQDTLAKLEQYYFLYSNQRTKLTEKRLTWHRSWKAFVESAEESLDVESEILIHIIEEYRTEWPTVEAKIRGALTSPTIADITITTCHKSKGLEWDNVRLHDDFRSPFCYNTEEKRYELKRLTRDPKDPETDLNPEEINLLYVAVTRAKRKVQLCGDLKRVLTFGQPNYDNQ